MTVKELKEKCKEMGLKNYSTLKKSDLEKLITMNATSIEQIKIQEMENRLEELGHIPWENWEVGEEGYYGIGWSEKEGYFLREYVKKDTGNPRDILDTSVREEETSEGSGVTLIFYSSKHPNIKCFQNNNIGAYLHICNLVGGIVKDFEKAKESLLKYFPQKSLRVHLTHISSLKSLTYDCKVVFSKSKGEYMYKEIFSYDYILEHGYFRNNNEKKLILKDPSLIDDVYYSKRDAKELVGCLNFLLKKEMEYV